MECSRRWLVLVRVNGGTQYVQRWAGRDTVGTDSGPVKPSRQVGGDSSRGNGNFGPVADVRTAASENLLVNRARTPAARASQPCLPGCGGGNVAGPRALQC